MGRCVPEGLDEPAPRNKLFTVSLIASEKRPIQARSNFMVMPHFSIRDHPNLEVLIVPGGVHTGEMANQKGMDWMARIGGSTRLVASVCTGAFLLAQAGVLMDHACTTHWEDIPDLRIQFPRLNVKEEVPWVEHGRIFSSAGISAGIDMSLHLVTRLAGKDLARKTARQMQYTWMGESMSQEIQ